MHVPDHAVVLELHEVVPRIHALSQGVLDVSSPRVHRVGDATEPVPHEHDDDELLDQDARPVARARGGPMHLDVHVDLKLLGAEGPHALPEDPQDADKPEDEEHRHKPALLVLELQKQVHLQLQREHEQRQHHTPKDLPLPVQEGLVELPGDGVLRLQCGLGLGNVGLRLVVGQRLLIGGHPPPGAGVGALSVVVLVPISGSLPLREDLGLPLLDVEVQAVEDRIDDVNHIAADVDAKDRHQAV
mmetsp:Transcript_84082/g.242758  ORF Transcript_84082/g.242758 Transcript_84082/m.242758 type:complete len:244 (-) Transcript_84082:254-985(-)